MVEVVCVRVCVCVWFRFRLALEPAIEQRDFLFCMSPTQATPPTTSAVVYLCTWPSANPNPLSLLFSPFAVYFPPTPSLFSPSITPSHHHPSVCFPDSSTLLLFYFFSLFTPLILLVCFLLLPPFIPFWFSLSTPQGRGMGLMNIESPEQISLSICRRIPRAAALIVSRKQSVY